MESEDGVVIVQALKQTISLGQESCLLFLSALM